MKDFTIALIQHASPVGKKKENLETTVKWAHKAKKRGAALVCFPELNITGHAGHPAMVKHAEAVPDGSSAGRLIDLAQELGVYICAGIAEDDAGIYYNTQFIAGPEGFIGKQRKIHPSADEYFYFRGGTDTPVFDLPFARIGIAICYDNQHPEVSRCLAVKGAEVILAVHAARGGATPKAVRQAKSRWGRIHSCRAYDNGCYVCLCNTAGRSARALKGVKADHAGGCLVFDPNGKLIAKSKSRDVRDEMVLARLKAKPVSDRRNSACFTLRTRRPDAFKALSEPTR
jgi:predicted amidohydrolase